MSQYLGVESMKKEINSVQKGTIEPRLDEREEEIDILETIRLSKLFPNAVDFALLSQVFPDVFLNSKKMIALKLEPTTECIELLEEKDVSGITETEIIPIEYHSSYTYGLSIKIKELLEEKPDFFKVFFQKYEKIVLDATAEEDDSALIIRDYGSEERIVLGYDLYYFIKCAFKSFNVDEEKIQYLSSFVFIKRSPLIESNTSSFKFLSNIFPHTLSEKSIDSFGFPNISTFSCNHSFGNGELCINL